MRDQPQLAVHTVLGCNVFTMQLALVLTGCSGDIGLPLELRLCFEPCVQCAGQSIGRKTRFDPQGVRKAQAEHGSPAVSSLACSSLQVLDQLDLASGSGPHTLFVSIRLNQFYHHINSISRCYHFVVVPLSCVKESILPYHQTDRHRLIMAAWL